MKNVFSFRIRSAADENKKVPILLLITIDGRKYYTLPEFSTKATWKTETTRAKLNGYIERGNLYLNMVRAKGETVSADALAAYILTGVLAAAEKQAEKMVTLRELMNDYLAQNNISYSVQRRYARTVAIAEKLHPKILPEHLTYEFAGRFVAYLRKEKNSNNTINKKIQVLRTLAKTAEYREIKVSKGVFEYRVKRDQTDKGSLTLAEVQKLEAAFYAGKFTGKLYKVAGMFLLACFTGLRYNEIVRVVANIHKEFDGKTITTTQSKTGKVLVLPVSDRAAKLLNSRMISTVSNQQCNRWIPEMLEQIGVKKDLTFHCSRHTFAFCCLELGIPVTVLQKLLNHSNITETMVYAKIADGAKTDAVKLWDK